MLYSNHTTERKYIAMTLESIVGLVYAEESSCRANLEIHCSPNLCYEVDTHSVNAIDAISYLLSSKVKSISCVDENVILITLEEFV